MADKSTLTLIAEQLGLALEPVANALSSVDVFSAFMLELGWDTNTPIAAVQNLGAFANDILNAVENGLYPADAPRLIGQIVNLFSAVSKLSSASGLPATIDPVEFSNDFPGQFVDYLVADCLLSNHATRGSVLLACGVIRKTLKPKSGKRPAYVRFDIAWNDLGNVLNDPLGVFRNAYSWGGLSFDQNLFIGNMEALGRGLGLTVFSSSVGGALKAALTDGATSITSLQDFALRCQLIGNLVSEAYLTAGIDIYVLPPTASAAPGIAFLPYVTGAGVNTLTISDRLSLIMKAAFDLAGGILIRIRPDQPVGLSTGIFGGTPGSA